MRLNSIILYTEYEKERIRIVKEYIDRYYATAINFSSLSKGAGMNQKRLQAGFHQLTGYRMKEYQIHLRIEKAKEMLMDPKPRVAIIARKIGFKKSSRFGLAFKKDTSLTPEAYRLLHCN